jgi:hypothetical protein
MRSTDAGATWSAPELISVNNTWGPHYTGNDVAHGIEMIADGPHTVRRRCRYMQSVCTTGEEALYIHAVSVYYCPHTVRRRCRYMQSVCTTTVVRRR